MKIYSVVCLVSICGFFAACSSGSKNADEAAGNEEELVASVAATSPSTTFDVTDDPRATYEQYINEPENKAIFESNEPVERYLAFVKTLQLAYTTPEVDPDFEPLQDYLHPTFREDYKKHLEEFKSANKVRIYSQGSPNTFEASLLKPVYMVDGLYLEGQQAFLTVCEVDYATLVDGKGAVLDDTYGRLGSIVEMRFEDDKWWVFDEEVLLEYEEGGLECDFSEFDLEE